MTFYYQPEGLPLRSVGESKEIAEKTLKEYYGLSNDEILNLTYEGSIWWDAGKEK